jgi:hypothetical protein
LYERCCDVDVQWQIEAGRYYWAGFFNHPFNVPIDERGTFPWGIPEAVLATAQRWMLKDLRAYCRSQSQPRYGWYMAQALGDRVAELPDELLAEFGVLTGRELEKMRETIAAEERQLEEERAQYRAVEERRKTEERIAREKSWRETVALDRARGRPEVAALQAKLVAGEDSVLEAFLETLTQAEAEERVAIATRPVEDLPPMPKMLDRGAHSISPAGT